MADQKISQLTSYTAIQDADVLPIVDTANAITKKTAWSNIKSVLATYFATLTTSQTLTNKTLTSPDINVGSDVTGDMYYRNSGGHIARLPKGTDGQIVRYVAGLPAASDETAQVDASYAAKGIVRFLTDAAASGITVSSGIANVNYGVGANQIVKLNGSSQLPAVDGSLLTNLATNSLNSHLLYQSSVPLTQNIADTNKNALFTKSIPGGTLSTGNAVRIHLEGTFTNGSGTTTTTFTMEYGATTVQSFSLGAANNGNVYNFVCDMVIYATGATGTQTTKGRFLSALNSATTSTALAGHSLLSAANSTEDSTAAKNVVISTQLSSTSNASTLVITDYTIEVLR